MTRRVISVLFSFQCPNQEDPGEPDSVSNALGSRFDCARESVRLHSGVGSVFRESQNSKRFPFGRPNLPGEPDNVSIALGSREYFGSHRNRFEEFLLI